MSTAKYPNRDALRKAHDIYLDAMSSFIIKCLGEDISEDESIDFSNIAYLIREYWNDTFVQQFKRADPYYEARSAVQLIVEGRNRASHPPWDLDRDFTRTHLFLIANALENINRVDGSRKIESIRDELFFDDTAECLAEAEKRLEEAEAESANYKASLSEAEERLEAEKHKYEKNTAKLSQQIIDNALEIENISEQLKKAKEESDKDKKNLAEKKRDLEKAH